MNTKQSLFFQKESGLKLVLSLLLVFTIALTNISSFSFLANMEIDKIEKLAEGENDIELEEKEKNLEVEEDSFLSSNFDRFNLLQNGWLDGQNRDQLPFHFLKTPTPPPDFI